MRNMTTAVTAFALLLAGCSTAHLVDIKPVQRGGIGVTKNAPDAYAEAKKQLEAGRPALALEGFRRALRDSSQFVDALNGMAVAYDQLGRFDLSRRFYELALAADPTNTKVLHNIEVSARMSGPGQQLAAADGEPAFVPASKTVEVQSERVSPGEIMVPLDEPKPVAPMRASASSDKELPVNTVEHKVSQERVSPGEIVVPLDSAKSATPVQSSTTAERLLVLNAVGRRGQAGRMRQYLAGVGWVDARIGNTKMRLQRSVIVYPRGSRATAERLATSLPFAHRLIQGRRVSRIVLMLGRNASRFDNGLKTRV